jgi:hypothetical protein
MRSLEARLASKLNCPIGDVWWGGWAELDEPVSSSFSIEDRDRFEKKANEWRRLKRDKLLMELRR